MAKPKRRVQKTSKKRKAIPVLKTPFFENQFWKKYWKEALIIAITAIGLYAMCIDYQYVLDDQIVITKNDFTKMGFSGMDDILTTESFTGYFGEQKDLLAGARYRPLSIMTFAFEYGVMGGLNRQVSHSINILLYALLGLLIFRVLSILFPIENEKYWFFTLPFIGAMLYVTHPIHSEVVANIKGRDEIMTMIGSIGILYAVLKYLKTDQKLWLILSGVFMFLGLMAKENALTFLAVIPLTLYFFTNADLKKHITVLIPSFMGVVLYFVFRYNAIGFLFDSPAVVNDVMNDPFIGMSGAEKSATIIYTLGEYLRLQFFPLVLTHDYYPYHVPIMNWGKIGSLLSFFLYVGLTILAFRGLKKKTPWSYGIFYYFITLSIVSNVFVVVGTFMNERFLFMPSFGFCLALAWLLTRYLPAMEKKHVGFKYAAFALGAAYIFGLGIRTLTRVPVWQSPLTLNGAAVTVSEKSARSNCFMASALYTKARGTKDVNEKWGLIQEAGFFIRRSVSILPQYGSANQMFAGILGEEYLIDKDLDKLLNGFRGILRNRATVKYIRDFTTYLVERNTAKKKMSDFFYDAGYEIIVKQHGRLELGVEYLTKGVNYNPQNAKLNWALGKTYERMGQTAQANQFLNKAYSLNPALRNKQE